MSRTLYSTTHQRSVEVQFGRYQKNILQEWCMVKNLSCVSYGSLKHFPHTFTTYKLSKVTQNGPRWKFIILSENKCHFVSCSACNNNNFLLSLINHMIQIRQHVDYLNRMRSDEKVSQNNTVQLRNSYSVLSYIFLRCSTSVLVFGCWQMSLKLRQKHILLKAIQIHKLLTIFT